MWCENCGKEIISSSARFCPFCGTAVNREHTAIGNNGGKVREAVSQRPPAGKKEIDFQTLKLYLQNTCDLEKQLYGLRQWKDRIEGQIQEYQNPKVARMEPRKKREGTRKKQKSNIGSTIVLLIVLWGILAIYLVPVTGLILQSLDHFFDDIFAPFVAIFNIILSPMTVFIIIFECIFSWGIFGIINLICGNLKVYTSVPSWASWLEDYLQNSTGKESIVALILAIVIGVYLIVRIIKLIKETEKIKENNKEIDRFNQFVDEENMRIDAENQKRQRNNEEIRQKAAVVVKNLQFELARTDGDIKQTENTLDTFYKVGILDPVYWHNFAAVCSFYGYLRTGRTRRLEVAEYGADIGAYNLYENEKRMNLIITNLAEVNCNLKKIEKNQQDLYNALKEINQNISLLSAEMQSFASNISESAKHMRAMREDIAAIKDNSELSAYHNGITAYNSGVLKDIAVYREIWR